MEWISVNDKLPNVYQPVLLAHDKWVGEGYLIAESSYKFPENHLFYVYSFHGSFVDITHWMPLPELPKNE